MAERKYKNPYQEYTDGTDVGADKLVLSSTQQAGISQAKADWQKASDAGDQAGMDAAHQAAERIRAAAGYSGGANGGAYNPFASDGDSGVHMSATHTASPKWTPTYARERADTVAQIKSRAPFSYDPEKDPTYQQYKQQYERGAAKSMQDTMGQVMTRTGGLASSFAQVAGQQSYNAYMSELADKVPELRQLAYQMYMDEGDRLRSDLQMYDSLDSSDAARWQGTVLAPYQADRAYAMDVDNQIYNRGRDALSDSRYEREYADQRGDVAYNREYQERKDQEAKAAALAELLASGGDYSGYGSLYGMTPEQQQALQALAQEGLDYDRRSKDLSLQEQELGLALTKKQIANYGRSSGGNNSPTKPNLTYAQTMQAIKDGNVTQAVKDAYEYYLGETYSEDAGKKDAADSAKGSGTTAALVGYLSGPKAPLLGSQRASEQFDTVMKAGVARQIRADLESGKISEAEADRLLKQYGY